MKPLNSLSFSLIGLLLLQAGCTGTHTTPKSFAHTSIASPEFFSIAPWDMYHADKTNAPFGGAGLRTIADCHFNLGGFAYPNDLGHFEKLGLSAIVMPDMGGHEWSQLADADIDRTIKTVVTAAGSSPAVAGFYIRDEPGVKDFPALAKAVAAVKKYAPGKLAYVNLFPDYATLGAPDKSQLGTENYTEYLERFISEVKPQILSYDNYMIQYSHDQAVPKAAASFYKNLIEVRRVAQKHDLPFVVIVGSNQIFPDSFPPSPASLMLQAYVTLAAGSRGVNWFTYYRGGFFIAPVDEQDRKTLVWAWLQEVNRQIVTLEPVLSHLASTGVFFSTPAPTDNLPLLPGKLVESVTSPTPLMIGEFKDREGKSYVMVVNLSLEKSAKFKLKTTQPIAKINVISAMDGAPSPMNQADGCWLTAGQGVLLELGKIAH